MKIKQSTQELDIELNAILNDECTYRYCTYLKFNGLWIEIGRSKPAIDTTLYYNDEEQEPEVNFEKFAAYNQQNKPKKINFDNLVNSSKRYYLQKFGNGISHVVTYILGENTSSDFIIITTEIANAINAEIDKINANYDKRLKNYWKRYRDKVTTYGYWANR